MTKIAIANRKGGVGKSTTAAHLAGALAIAGKNVLLVDLDPQGNIAGMLGAEYENTMADVLTDKIKAREALIQARERLYLLPSDSTLANAANVALQRDFDPQYIISEKLAELTGFDFVIIDTAPSISKLTVNAMFYADKMLVPVSMARLAVEALGKVYEETEHLRKRGAAPLSYVVPTFADYRKSLTSEMLETLKKYFNGTLCEPIRYQAKYDELDGQLIFEAAPKSRGTEDYGKLAKAVLIE